MRRWERNIPATVVLLGTLLILAGCGPCPVAERSAAPPGPTPVTGPEAPRVRLQEASGSGILILEEDTDASWDSEPDPDDDGLGERPAPPLPSGHKTFRDHHVTLYVSDPAAGLEAALGAAAATGGQVINYPISGFEDLGPDERTLVFDARVYPSFLRRIREEGEVAYPEIGSAEFVTVRLTVKEKTMK